MFKILKIFNLKYLIKYFLIFLILFFFSSIIYFFLAVKNFETKNNALIGKNNNLQKELNELKDQNQYKINKALEKIVADIQNGYKASLSSFEKIQDLKAQKQNTTELDKLYALVLSDLGKLKYASAQSNLKELDLQIEKKLNAIASSVEFPSNIPSSNSPPASGYSIQQVKTDNGSFNVAIVAADLNSTRIIVDTASQANCSNNCPVLSLGDYVARNGAYAGINGSFFCPTEYPSCAGKTNSFDLLVMNKNKYYFNSDNNVYSTNPAVIFGSGWIRFVGRALDWGRDTGVDGVLSNYPLYVSGGENVFGGSGDAKLTSKGPRTFIANKGNLVYIGIIYSASSEDAAKVLKSLGMENAMGLDQGGSTALWFNGYKAGPGRSIPNAILFIRK